MAKTISTFFTVLMLLLAPPSAAALATWNTLPDQPLYPIKRGLENAALILLSPSFQARSSLQSELVGRRTDEAVKLLSTTESTKGLEELRSEIDAAKLQASQANDPVARRIAVEKLISKLQAANKALETVSATPAPTTTSPKSAGYVPRRPSTTGALPATQTQTEPAPPQQQIIYVNQQETKVVYKTTLVSVVVQQQVINTQTQIQQDIQQLQQESQTIQQQQEEDHDDDKPKPKEQDDDDKPGNGDGPQGGPNDNPGQGGQESVND